MISFQIAPTFETLPTNNSRFRHVHPFKIIQSLDVAIPRGKQLCDNLLVPMPTSPESSTTFIDITTLTWPEHFAAWAGDR